MEGTSDPLLKLSNLVDPPEIVNRAAALCGLSAGAWIEARLEDPQVRSAIRECLRLALAERAWAELGEANREATRAGYTPGR